jgi:hypothetical protein
MPASDLIFIPLGAVVALGALVVYGSFRLTVEQRTSTLGRRLGARTLQASAIDSWEDDGGATTSESSGSALRGRARARSRT